MIRHFFFFFIIVFNSFILLSQDPQIVFDRPGIADSPYIVDTNNWIIESGITGTKDSKIKDIIIPTVLLRKYIGFKTEAYKRLNLTPSGDFSQHGSDQDWIMKNIYPHAKESFYHSVLTNREPQPDTNPFWETDLVQRYIGSAGCIEMELVRFLQRHQKPEHTAFEKRHPNIFYWHNV